MAVPDVLSRLYERGRKTNPSEKAEENKKHEHGKKTSI